MLQKAINVTVTNRLSPQFLTDVQKEGPSMGLCENQLSFGFVKSICPHTFGFRPDWDSGEIINGTWAHNDVHISIDFSLIDPTAFGASAAVAVYPTLMGSIDTGTMFRDIVPFPLPPGVNYYATVSVKGRQAYDGRSQTASSFGLFSSPKTYLVPSIRYVVADPLETRSQNGVSNVSTLRLSCEFNTAEFRVEMDQRDKTVFAGFATVGGLFTFVSGIFTLIFGTTFLCILFDLKPLSVFGLIQEWDRKRIVNAYLDAYPLLRAELELEASQRDVVAVLQDHLLDMELIKEVLDAESQGESDSASMITNNKDEGREERTSLHNAWGTPELEEGAMFPSNSSYPPRLGNKAA
ncbi:hypothetical protein BJ165DRAFT_1528935 [Panaeolus papilionaceus]|nr:hypothetical protein BJ165DRAFT_1528935 [Panaeolus papilionaceus]